MKNVGDNIKKNLIKREEAILRFHKRKEEFLIAKQQITKEIEEARSMWKTTLEQLPNLPFS